MFEKEIDRLTARLTSIVQKQDNFVYLSDIISNEGLPLEYKNFMTAEVNWRIYREALKLGAHPGFDIQGPEFESFFLALDNLYRKRARFIDSEYDKIAAAAVKIRMNMLIRPRTTLKWYVFRGEPTKTINEICKRLDYFTDYDYLLDGYRKYIDKISLNCNSDKVMSDEKFVSIIDKIDNDYISEKTASEFVKIVEPLFELFESLEYTELPMEVFVLYFDDKKFGILAEKCENALSSGKKSCSREELVEIINSTIDEKFQSQDKPFSKFTNQDNIDEALSFDIAKEDFSQTAPSDIDTTKDTIDTEDSEDFDLDGVDELVDNDDIESIDVDLTEEVSKLADEYTGESAENDDDDDMLDFADDESEDSDKEREELEMIDSLFNDDNSDEEAVADVVDDSLSIDEMDTDEELQNDDESVEDMEAILSEIEGKLEISASPDDENPEIDDVDFSEPEEVVEEEQTDDKLAEEQNQEINEDDNTEDSSEQTEEEKTDEKIEPNLSVVQQIIEKKKKGYYEE